MFTKKAFFKNLVLIRPWNRFEIAWTNSRSACRNRIEHNFECLSLQIPYSIVFLEFSEQLVFLCVTFAFDIWIYFWFHISSRKLIRKLSLFHSCAVCVINLWSDLSLKPGQRLLIHKLCYNWSFDTQVIQVTLSQCSSMLVRSSFLKFTISLSTNAKLSLWLVLLRQENKPHSRHKMFVSLKIIAEINEIWWN